MSVVRRRWQRVAVVLWCCALTALVVWALQPGYVVGWDLNVYRAAMDSMRAGHDPYADAMAIQRAYHAQAVHPAGGSPPYSYVYSPMTLPLVRLAAALPLTLAGTVYWLVYIAAVVAGLLVSWWMVRDEERPLFACLLPLVVFFPGLLENDVIFSGNVAYILYGAVLAGAWVGWTRGRWWVFYACVVAASCFKAPLLCLVVIAPLSARRQWMRAGVTSAVGIGLFLMQPHVWPELFRHYLEAVELQFSFNRDFSSSLPGILANALYELAPYQVVSAVAYALLAVAILSAMLVLRKRFLHGAISLQVWAPMVLLAAVLLNPRIMEYDLAPVTFSMALVLWRALRMRNGEARSAVVLGSVFVALNGVAAILWKPMACTALVASFLVGWLSLKSKSGTSIEETESRL